MIWFVSYKQTIYGTCSFHVPLALHMYVLGKLNTYNNIDNTYIITTYIYNQTIYLETVLKTKR